MLPTDAAPEARLYHPCIHPLHSPLGGFLSFKAMNRTQTNRKKRAEGWINGTWGELINSDLCGSRLPEDHLAAFQNALAQV